MFVAIVLSTKFIKTLRKKFLIILMIQVRELTNICMQVKWYLFQHQVICKCSACIPGHIALLHPPVDNLFSVLSNKIVLTKYFIRKSKYLDLGRFLSSQDAGNVVDLKPFNMLVGIALPLDSLLLCNVSPRPAFRPLRRRAWRRARRQKQGLAARSFEEGLFYIISHTS